jgi:digeranylgeranylglycerophospholipid reductase
MRSDVAVIGAGPAGSTAARTIAHRGFDVLLIEKDEYPGMTNVCAGAMPGSIIRDMGLDPGVIEKEISGQQHYFPWGMAESPLEDAVTVYRKVFDRSLAEKAVEDGAHLLNNTLVRDISVKAGGVSIDAGATEIESKLVIFADGPNTLAYRRLGFGFRPDADNTCASAVCEIEWADNPLDQFEFYYGYGIAPWGYGWVFPKRNTVNVGVGCLASRVRSNIMDSLNYLIRDHPLTRDRLKERKVVSLSTATIPVAPAGKIFGERALAVGDAAGMVDPISAGGIHHAIHGGRIAGGVCADALEEDDFSAGFLSRYQDRWERSRDYFFIYRKYLLSNAFLYLSRFDRNAYAKMTAISHGGLKGLYRALRVISWRES